MGKIILAAIVILAVLLHPYVPYGGAAMSAFIFVTSVVIFVQFSVLYRRSLRLGHR